jgi:GcrA cell cycle regulator
MSQIAEMMGRSKGSVCGLRLRMKLPPRPRAAQRDKRNPYGSPSSPNRNDGKPRAPRNAEDQSGLVAAQQNLEAAAEKGFPNGGKDFVELGSRDCRFINGDPMVGGHKFCGAKAVHGKSWCSHHYRVVFRDVR